MCHTQWHSHGWAHAYTTSVTMALRIYRNSKFFGCKVSSVLFNQCSILLEKYVCQLQLLYTDVASGALRHHTPAWALPWTPLGDFHPQTTCAHPTTKPLLRHCLPSVRKFSTPCRRANTPNFCTTPPASSPDDRPAIAHRGC